jgi:2-dehydropantoate 2-reductase
MSKIGVALWKPGEVERGVEKGRCHGHDVFRVGEHDGRITPRTKELVEILSVVDGSQVTDNLWGERWSKLCQNAMGNGVTAATGLTSPDCLRDPAIRRFQIALAAEAVRVGQALGYTLEKIRGIEPELYVRAAEGQAESLKEIEALLMPQAGSNPRGDIQRPSMAQDMIKGRRTEIDAMNGFIARKGAEVGIAAPSHVKLADLVTRIERGELKPSPSLLHPRP